MSSKQKLVVFDLDYTLWPFWVDTHVTPPFRKKYLSSKQNITIIPHNLCGQGNVVDAHGHKIKYYPEVPKILQTLHAEGYTLAVASRTSEIDGANQLLDLFNWDKYFRYKEIYPGCKVTHFNNFKRKSGMEYKDMIFFDDENRNIIDINKLGVTSILVKNGMTLDVLHNGLEQHTNKRN